MVIEAEMYKFSYGDIPEFTGKVYIVAGKTDGNKLITPICELGFRNQKFGKVPYVILESVSQEYDAKKQLERGGYTKFVKEHDDDECLLYSIGRECANVLRSDVEFKKKGWSWFTKRRPKRIESTIDSISVELFPKSIAPGIVPQIAFINGKNIYNSIRALGEDEEYVPSRIPQQDATSILTTFSQLSRNYGLSETWQGFCLLEITVPVDKKVYKGSGIISSSCNYKTQNTALIISSLSPTDYQDNQIMLSTQGLIASGLRALCYDAVTPASGEGIKTDAEILGDTIKDATIAFLKGGEEECLNSESWQIYRQIHCPGQIWCFSGREVSARRPRPMCFRIIRL